MFILNQKSNALALDRSRSGEFARLGSAIPQLTATQGRELPAAMSMTDANTGIHGVTANAAVRMHAPVVATDTFWAYCPENKFGANPKNSHFQRWKVAY